MFDDPGNFEIPKPAFANFFCASRIGEQPANEQELLALLKPCPDEALRIWPVDRMVGNVRNNGPQLVLPVLSCEVPV